jgi:hypothetical protein
MLLSRSGSFVDGQPRPNPAGASARAWLAVGAGALLFAFGIPVLAEAQTCSLPDNYNCNAPLYGYGDEFVSRRQSYIGP